MTLPAPRIAAQNTPSAESAALEKAVFFHSLEEVFRAGRRKPAARAWAANEVNDWGNDALITTDEDADEPFHGAEGAGFKKSP